MTDMTARARELLENILRNDVKESDGAHWEYPESELQALLEALTPKVVAFAVGQRESQELSKAEARGLAAGLIDYAEGRIHSLDEIEREIGILPCGRSGEGEYPRPEEVVSPTLATSHIAAQSAAPVEEVAREIAKEERNNAIPEDRQEDSSLGSAHQQSQSSGEITDVTSPIISAWALSLRRELSRFIGGKPTRIPITPIETAIFQAYKNGIAEILHQHGHGAQGQGVGPRCPKCGGNTLHMGRVNDQIRIVCLNQQCRILRFPKELADFAQFFVPPVPPESATKEGQ
jgi:hypothetical protein